jgi:hypothetical protein
MHTPKIQVLALERAALWGYITFYKVSDPEKTKLELEVLRVFFLVIHKIQKLICLWI